MKYKIFMPSKGQTIDDCMEIEHLYSNCAIIEYLEHILYNRDGWEWMHKDHYESIVRCIDENNVVKDFKFELEYEPSFYIVEDSEGP